MGSVLRIVLAISAARILTAQAPSVQGAQSVFRVGSGVSAPSVVSKTDPEYSEEARKARVSGTVLLSVIIGADGSAGEIKVVRPLGSGLDEKAVQAVSAWKFRPGQKNGEPVAVQAMIEVNFRLLADHPEPAPRTAAEAYRRGTQLFGTQNVPGSIAMFDWAIALDRTWPDGYAARGRARLLQRNYSGAIADFGEALRLKPESAAWYESRGVAYAGFGQQSQAIEDYNRAIELTPNAPAGYFVNRGVAWLRSGDTDKAIEDLTAAIRLAPDNALAFQSRAGAFAGKSDWPDAIADYTAAIELNPTRILYDSRSEAKKNRGDVAGAEEDRKKALELGGAASPPSLAARISISLSDPTDTSLPPPKLMGPSEGAVFDFFPRHLVLTWEASQGAASYVLEWDYSHNGGWNSEGQNRTGYGLPVNGLTASIDFVGAQPGRWRVWPVNAKGQRGTASEWRTFRFTR